MARREGGDAARRTGRDGPPISAAGVPAASGGRGAAGKTPFVVAVSTGPKGRPRKLKLVPVRGFHKREVARGAPRWLAPGSEVVTDGLGCWSVLGEGCVHSSGNPHRRRPQGGSPDRVQMGQHNARQHQKRDHRDLPQDRPRSCRALPRQLRLALQPAPSTPDHDPPLRPQCRTNRPNALPNPHRWMRIRDKQESLCSLDNHLQQSAIRLAAIMIGYPRSRRASSRSAPFGCGDALPRGVPARRPAPPASRPPCRHGRSGPATGCAR